MPLYEYQCRSCQTRTDIRHGFKETTTEVCPACGGPLQRLFNPAGIVFKGSGFYVTDSRKKSGADGATAAKSDPAAKSDSATKNEGATKGDAPVSGASEGAASKSADAKGSSGKSGAAA